MHSDPSLFSCKGIPSDEKYYTSFGGYLLKHLHQGFLQESLVLTLLVNKSKPAIVCLDGWLCSLLALG